MHLLFQACIIDGQTTCESEKDRSERKDVVNDVRTMLCMIFGNSKGSNRETSVDF